MWRCGARSARTLEQRAEPAQDRPQRDRHVRLADPDHGRPVHHLVVEAVLDDGLRPRRRRQVGQPGLVQHRPQVGDLARGQPALALVALPYHHDPTVPGDRQPDD